MPRKYTRREWIPTRIAAEKLHLTPQSLLYRIKAKIFKRGIHYRNVSSGDKRPQYQFCLDEINKLYE
jgi:DNA-binding Lrp family transcriptional regulator